MTRDEAFEWLTGPAGASELHARKLLADLGAHPAVHVAHGLDVRAPGLLLTFDGTSYATVAAPPRKTTPWEVAQSLAAAGVSMAGGGRRGWVTFWAGDRAVRAELHGAGTAELELTANRLRRAGWTVEVARETSAGWLRVTQEASGT